MSRSDHVRLPPRDKPFPRKVRNGIKLKQKEGFGVLPWPAAAWLEVLETLVSAEVREEGMAYALSGQTSMMSIEPGRVEALVQGRAGQPYRTATTVKVFSPEVWDRLIEAMSGEAVYAAKLLGGEAPPELQRLGADLGASPAPSVDDVSMSCTCALGAPCKHVATVVFLLIERLRSDPRLIFTLRGMKIETLVMRLQEARSIRTQGSTSAHAAPASGRQGSAKELSECLDDFWRPGPQLESVESAEAPAFAPHALLRRLGPSPMGGKFPLVGLLASIYDTVSDEARRLMTLSESGAEPVGGADADLEDESELDEPAA